MTAPPYNIIEMALGAASRSICQKSKRGVVMYLNEVEERRTVTLATASNAPCFGSCEGDEACRTNCGRRCFHAEAIVCSLLRPRHSKAPVEIVHVKLGPDRSVAPSGPPSCADCAKQMMLAGIAAVWLYHGEAGWRRYEINEFLRLSIVPRVADVPVPERTTP